MGNLEITIKLLIIMVLSGLIGLDREMRHKPAGLKTHILVGMGSTIFMMVSIYVYDMFLGKAQVDPGRIAAQVVTGIGFLGAGTIIQSQGSVLGLTTAASLWTVSGIGLAVGCGMYYLAAMSTVVVIVVFLVTNRLAFLFGQEVGRVREKITKRKKK